MWFLCKWDQENILGTALTLLISHEMVLENITKRELNANISKPEFAGYSLKMTAALCLVVSEKQTNKTEQ